VTRDVSNQNKTLNDLPDSNTLPKAPKPITRSREKSLGAKKCGGATADRSVSGGEFVTPPDSSWLSMAQAVKLMKSTSLVVVVIEGACGSIQREGGTTVVGRSSVTTVVTTY